MQSQTGTIILTSTGLSGSAVHRYFLENVHVRSWKRAAIVTTAAKAKLKDKYVQLAKKQIESSGLTASLANLETDPCFDFSPFDVIYVCGGNTFTLLKYAIAAGFKQSVEALLTRHGCYIGVSAGSIILSPTIDTANEIDPDPNVEGIKDLQALELVGFHVAVHYEDSMEKQVVNFENRYQTSMKRIGNDQAVVIENGNDPILIG